MAGSYSRFAEIGDALGVLGFPQSTAGRRYEISIYILQPGRESDNLKAKLRGERSSLERPVGADGAGGVPWAPGTWWQHGLQRCPREHPAPLPWEAVPNSSILRLDNLTGLSWPSCGQKKIQEEKIKEEDSSNRANSTIWGLFFSQDLNED